MQALTLDEVRRELRKYIHSEDLINCHLNICNNPDISSLLEAFFQTCPYLNPSRASYSPKVNFIWIRYFRNTREVFWLDMEQIRVNELQQRIQRLLEPDDVYRNNVCLDIYILPERGNNRTKIKEVIENFKDKIQYLEAINKEKQNKILKKITSFSLTEKFWNFIGQILKFLSNFLLLSSLFALVIWLDLFLYLFKLGLPTLILENNNILHFIKLFLLIFINSFLIPFIPFIILVITLLHILEKISLIYLISFALIIILVSILLLKLDSRWRKHLLLGFSFIKLPITLLIFFEGVLLFSHLILFSSYPLYFFILQNKIKNSDYHKLMQYVETSLDIILQLKSNLEPGLFLKKINNQTAIILDIEKNLIFYYSTEDLKDPFKDNLVPALQKKHKVKDFCKYIQKEKEKEKLSPANIIYFIFFLPAAKYKIYPLKGEQQDLLQIKPIKDAKIESLNKTELKNLLNKLFPFCNKTSFKSSQNKTSTKQGT